MIVLVPDVTVQQWKLSILKNISLVKGGKLMNPVNVVVSDVSVQQWKSSTINNISLVKGGKLMGPVNCE